jgi:hypothetical protein
MLRARADKRRTLDIGGIKKAASMSLVSSGENLDLVIFHSAPLIKVGTGNRITTLQDSTLDFDMERRLILETFKRNEIGVDIRFDAVTTDKLIEVLD